MKEDDVRKMATVPCGATEEEEEEEGGGGGGLV